LTDSMSRADLHSAKEAPSSPGAAKAAARALS
jgi:hypothetical protein